MRNYQRFGALKEVLSYPHPRPGSGKAPHFVNLPHFVNFIFCSDAPHSKENLCFSLEKVTYLLVLHNKKAFKVVSSMVAKVYFELNIVLSKFG